MATDTNKTWIERMASDPSLQDFVSAEICRAGIELATAKGERDHWRHLAEHWYARAGELTSPRAKVQRLNRDRQFAFRKRHQFAPPMLEGIS